MTLILCYTFLLHFIADFLLQSREMAKQKSTNVAYLMLHVMIQWLVVFGGLSFILEPIRAYQIACLNAGFHGLIDWNVWRLYKQYVYWRYRPETAEEFKYWEHQSFYTVIGFDQLAHFISITVAIGIVL